MIRKLFSILYISALVASCTKEGDTTLLNGADSYDVTIAPTIQTRATELSFESGDEIGLSIIMDADQSTFAENYQMYFDGTSFGSDLIWYGDNDATSTLVAYYPYISGDALPSSFTIQADQTSSDAYTASDLMVALKEGTTPSASTSITFNHVLTRIVVDVDNQSGSEISSIEIEGAYSTAKIDLTESVISVDRSSSKESVKCPLWSDDIYKAIIIPQEVTLTFKVTFSSGSVVAEEKGSVDFASGKEYTANMTIIGETMSVNISNDIDDWSDGGIIPDVADDVAFEEFDDYFVYDGATYNFKTYSIAGYGDLTIMTDNMRYIPQGKTVSSDASDGSGLWYPYKLNVLEGHSVTDDDFDYSDHTEVVVLTDEESIAKNGYLYTIFTALNDELTRDNYDQFEGAQGICPPGWHIPTKVELTQLSGECILESAIATAPFYNSSVSYAAIQTANEQGFNHVYPGAVTNSKYGQTIVTQDYTDSDSSAESIVGKNSTTYYMGSTANSIFSEGSVNFGNYFSLMTSHANAYIAKGKISVLYCTAPYGQSLRCVKDNN